MIAGKSGAILQPLAHQRGRFLPRVGADMVPVHVEQHELAVRLVVAKPPHEAIRGQPSTARANEVPGVSGVALGQNEPSLFRKAVFAIKDAAENSPAVLPSSRPTP